MAFKKFLSHSFNLVIKLIDADNVDARANGSDCSTPYSLFAKFDATVQCYVMSLFMRSAYSL